MKSALAQRQMRISVKFIDLMLRYYGSIQREMVPAAEMEQSCLFKRAMQQLKYS